MSAALFITGMQRSGTTLLDKLLAAQPSWSVLSQPFPLLMVHAKRRFLASRGIADEAYPLGDLFLERRYTARELDDHLDGSALTPSEVAAVIASMAGYSGQYTRFAADRWRPVVDQLPAAPLAAMLKALYDALAHRPAPLVAGAKETSAEELVPHLLANGFRVVIVVRDPRDVLTSLNHGDGERFGGLAKPTLFNLRQWRKSVAFALGLAADPRWRGRFAWLRLEDLVGAPGVTLGALGAALELAMDSPPTALVDQGGRPWLGNSSHDAALAGVESRPVGRWRSLLPPAAARLTAAVCGPELLALGYPLTDEERRLDVASVLASTPDPYQTQRPGLEGYQPAANAEVEARRRTYLAAGLPSPGEEAAWFLLPGVRAQLQRALGSQAATGEASG